VSSYLRNLSKRSDRLKVEISHKAPCKIGHPPNSLLTIERTGSTPSVSIFVRFTHDSYKLRALVIDFGSIFSLDDVDKRS
jgi:hypothetical protein